MLIFDYFFKATTLHSPTMILGQVCFILYSMDEWPTYDGPTIVPYESMKRIGSGRLKSTRLHNEMDIREEKTIIKFGLCRQPSHNRRSCKNRNQVQ